MRAEEAGSPEKAEQEKQKKERKQEMIRHIVMWKFKESGEGKTKEENMKLVTERLYALLPVIPELRRMEIGADISHTDMSMDLCLLTEFETVEDMKLYAGHPEHLKVSAYVRKVIDSRAVIDIRLD